METEEYPEEKPKKVVSVDNAYEYKVQFINDLKVKFDLRENESEEDLVLKDLLTDHYSILRDIESNSDIIRGMKAAE